MPPPPVAQVPALSYIACMTLPPRETLQQAVAKHDAEFNGVFFAARGNSGEFCNPGCRARKAETRQARFFETTRDALAAGYRPCKKCKPLKTGMTDPDWIEVLMAKVESDPAKRWHDYELEAMELDPAAVRRWFIANHGFTGACAVSPGLVDAVNMHDGYVTNKAVADTFGMDSRDFDP